MNFCIFYVHQLTVVWKHRLMEIKGYPSYINQFKVLLDWKVSWDYRCGTIEHRALSPVGVKAANPCLLTWWIVWIAATSAIQNYVFIWFKTNSILRILLHNTQTTSFKLISILLFSTLIHYWCSPFKRLKSKIHKSTILHNLFLFLHLSWNWLFFNNLESITRFLSLMFSQFNPVTSDGVRDPCDGNIQLLPSPQFPNFLHKTYTRDTIVNTFVNFHFNKVSSDLKTFKLRKIFL